MRPSTLRRSLPLALAAFLAGCGGGGHHDDGNCVQTVTPTANAAYAGVYSATYTPGGGAVGGGFEVAFSVGTTGALSGTVTNPSTNPPLQGTVSGTVLDRAGCGGETYLDLTYAYSEGNGGTLSAFRSKRSSIAGTYKLDDGGTLVVRTGEVLE